MASRQQHVHTIALLHGLLTLAVHGFHPDVLARTVVARGLEPVRLAVGPCASTTPLPASASISPADAAAGGRPVPPSTSLHAGMLPIPA